MKFLFLIFFSGFGISTALGAQDVLELRLGFVKKLPCDGRLFISAVGNERLVSLEALPKELGCAVILKPTGAGETNLILETSAGTVNRVLHITR